MKKPLNPEILLEHVGWMKNLARSLVRDETRADDIVQQTLLAAVEKPPRESRAAPTWLKKVLRNFAVRDDQAETRRRRRERRAARQIDATPVATEVLERAEVQRQLVSRVFELDEPFRRAILLRFFEELSPRAIADLEGVDVSTVRRWLREALGRLRRELDSNHGGNRRLWQMALLPVLGLDNSHRLAAASGRSSGAGLVSRSIASGVIMKLKTTALLSVLAILIVIAATIQWSASGDRSSDFASRADVDPASAEITPAVAEVATPAAPAATLVAATDTPPLARGLEIFGTVSDSETGEEISGATVKLGDQSVVTDVEGLYRIRGLGDGEHHLSAIAENYARRDAHVHVSTHGPAQRDFALDPAIELLVLVVNENDEPVAGAEIEGYEIKQGFVVDLGQTGEDGSIVVPGISRLKLPTFVATKKGYVYESRGEIRIDKNGGTGEIRISLRTIEKLHRVIIGTIVDPDGHPLPGITVHWVPWIGRQSPRDATVTDAKGTYTLAFEHEREECHLVVHGEGWSPRILTKVRSGTPDAPAVFDFTLDPAHWLEGRVVDEQGRPIEGARVSAMPDADSLTNYLAFPQIVRRTKTDPSGAFRLEGLAGPTVAVQIGGTSWSPAKYKDVFVDQRRSFTLKSMGVIRGQVVDAETSEPISVFNVKLIGGGGYRVIRVEPGESFTSEDGRFVLRDLHRNSPFDLKVEAGGYSSAVHRSIPSRPRREKNELVVRLSTLRPLVGVIFDDAQRAPISGARVELALWESADLYWQNRQRLERFHHVMTDANGEFQIEEGEPDTLFVHAVGYSRLILPPERRGEYLDRTGKLWIPLARGETLSGKYSPDRPAKDPRLRLVRERRFPDLDATTRLHHGFTRPDDQGRFEWPHLNPGNYLLFAVRGTGEPTFTTVGRKVRIEAGVPAVVEFGDDLGEHEFTGQLVYEGKETFRLPRVTLRPTFQWHYGEFVAEIPNKADLRFRIEGLRSGEYEIEVKAYDWKTARKLPALVITGDTQRVLNVPAGE